MKKTVRRLKGISLIEILISLLILSIGISFSIRIFSAGRFFIFTAENKALAMRVATVQMEKYLARSYAGLEKLIADGNSVVTGADTDPRFTYRIAVTAKEEVNSSVSPAIRIPYMEVEVVVNYSEEKVDGSTDAKSVRIVNIVPYPYYHIQNASCDFTGSCSGNNAAMCSNACPPVATAADESITTVELNHKTRKNFLILYNLGIQGMANTGIDPSDILETQCYLGNVPLPIRTGTPILSQPFISNVLAVENVDPSDAGNPQYLKLYWSTASAGRVQLKWVNLIVIEIEP